MFFLITNCRNCASPTKVVAGLKYSFFNYLKVANTISKDLVILI